MMMFKLADNKRESGNLNKKVKINDKTKQKQLTRAVQNFERRWRVEKLEALSSTNFEIHGHGCLFAETAAYVTVTRTAFRPSLPPCQCHWHMDRDQK